MTLCQRIMAYPIGLILLPFLVLIFLLIWIVIRITDFDKDIALRRPYSKLANEPALMNSKTYNLKSLIRASKGLGFTLGEFVTAGIHFSLRRYAVENP